MTIELDPCEDGHDWEECGCECGWKYCTQCDEEYED